MDKIEFRYRKFSYGMDDYAIPAVEIFINGRDFYGMCGSIRA